MRDPGDPTSDRGVSEVMGELLMVTIAVIVVSVLAAQILGMWAAFGGTGPRASLEVADAAQEYPNEAFTIEHRGGEQLTAGNLEIIVRDVDESTVNGTLEYQGSTFEGDGMTAYINGWSAPFVKDSTAGDVINIEGSGSDRLTSGTEYQVLIVHTPSGVTIADGTATIE